MYLNHSSEDSFYYVWMATLHLWLPHCSYRSALTLNQFVWVSGSFPFSYRRSCCNQGVSLRRQTSSSEHIFELLLGRCSCATLFLYWGTSPWCWVFREKRFDEGCDGPQGIRCRSCFGQTPRGQCSRLTWAFPSEFASWSGCLFFGLKRRAGVIRG